MNKVDKADPASILRKAIESGHFMPSERLVETELATWLGTNRSKVKIALGKLEQEGLVVSEPNRGARVRVINEKEALEILEIRTALESLVAGKAALNATAEDRKRLRDLLDALRRAIDFEDFTAYSSHNGVLHAEIRRMSGHATASGVLATLNSQLVRFQFRTILFPGRIHESLKEHAEIVEAICAGDQERAERAMREHLSSVSRTLQRSLSALAMDDRTRPTPGSLE